MYAVITVKRDTKSPLLYLLVGKGNEVSSQPTALNDHDRYLLLQQPQDVVNVRWTALDQQTHHRRGD